MAAPESFFSPASTLQDAAYAPDVIKLSSTANAIRFTLSLPECSLGIIAKQA
jgi:hypothetical protein